jgi:serine protease AprX
VPRAERLTAQIRALTSGTAILQVSPRTDQAALRRSLARARVRAVFFRHLPFVAVRGTGVRVRRAARLRGVVAAHMDARNQLHLHESVPLVYGGAEAVSSTWSAGFDGRGQTVAVVDSGVDGLHPDLTGRMAANVKVADTRLLFEDGSPVYVECPVACTTDGTGGHGTHVAGTIAGDGTASDGYYRGVAPGAKLVGLSVGEGPVIFSELAAYDWVLANREKLGIVAVNNSFGQSGDDLRYDSTAPVNVATKVMHDAGITVVFSAGNSGVGARPAPSEGGSDCSTKPATGGGREATDGVCKINTYSVAPWVIGVANGRKDSAGGPGDQPLAFSSSRGDPVAQESLDGKPVDYLPTLTAPGTNIRSARATGGTTTPLACGSAEAPACVPPPDAVQYEPFYMPLSGTSMAAPHVAGAVAVVQSAAVARLGRRLTPGEVRGVLVRSAQAMTKSDGLWDWPCGAVAGLIQPCGEHIAGTTGKPYERWQVGAGYLDVAGALREVDKLAAPAVEPTTGGGSGGAPAPSPPAAPPGTGTPSTPGGPTTPGAGTGGGGDREARARARRRAALKRCLTRARSVRRKSAKQQKRARAAAVKRCRARYG